MRAPRSRNTVRTFLLAGAAGLVALASPVRTHAEGAAQGYVAIVSTDTHAYGYSAFPDSSSWMSITLVGRVLDVRVGDYIGSVVTDSKAYVYNGVSNRWISTIYSGTFLEADARGATAVCWTDRGCYAIATVWVVWRGYEFRVGEVPLGGGSAGQFALVWTSQRAMAYNASTGQWTTHELLTPALGGMVSDKIGLVWTDKGGVAFDPDQGAWIPTTLWNPEGVSASGGGDVGLIWSLHEANAFVDSANSWFGLQVPQDVIQGGSAGGHIGVVWCYDIAYAFNATQRRWTTTALQGAGHSGVNVGPSAAGRFLVFPNPTSGSSLQFQVPAGADPWRIEIVEVTGRRVRIFDLPGSLAPRIITWEGLAGHGDPLPPGVYWATARAGSVLESRRFVLVP